MKKITILLLVLILCTFVFAVTLTIPSFHGESNPTDINFTGNENHTVFLSVPLYAYVQNITLNIEGLQSS